ncbi:phosphate ABC transporter substrate-binding protein [Pseudorhizobium pelagicum]|uniref:Phosphate ABC transporter substrate-binding protein n=1 Tax=Pseudorhizobium pelagicum TaxID=1509405 RepID=A0A922TBA1_9HYPH|nr:phosphate ABC transporter substrate-binding protein [Pseudorhizobium pelagicum]KEQ03705.1 phosphate ABC transporter substrate-binding protein [Pseudorhizobium pelagicum]KEQ08240.1 phosphate ABC transporter substrate-binding protein [Pseudorhizobium pelagicum]
MAKRYPAAGPVTLTTLLADNASTKSLKAGRIGSDLIRFDYLDYPLVFDGFKPMVRKGRFDFGELAIVTYLQAHAFGKPLVLLPAVIGARFQHHCICYDGRRGTVKPSDLSGSRVAVRSYTQTTGVWVRGILQEEYGLDPAGVTWICFEDSHLQEFRDPANVVRADEGQTPLGMLLAGEVDAALLGSDMPGDPHLLPVIPEPKAAGLDWHRRTGVIPMNHMAVVHADLAAQRPDVVHELYRLLLESRDHDTPAGDGMQMRLFGMEALRPSLEAAVRFAFDQGVIPRPIEVDELFDETTRLLGALTPPRA